MIEKLVHFCEIAISLAVSCQENCSVEDELVFDGHLYIYRGPRNHLGIMGISF